MSESTINSVVATSANSGVVPSEPARTLLLTSPVIDTRFPWARWQQPALLYREAARIRSMGADFRLVDVLATPKANRLRREKVQRLFLDGQPVDQWRFGRSRGNIATELRALAKQGWRPNRVVLECFATFWWRGAHEMVELIREVFPETSVDIVGAYAEQAPDHVRRVTGANPAHLEHDGCLAADWGATSTRPRIGYLTTLGGRRTAADVADEIRTGVGRGMTLFAFAEHALLGKHPDLFAEILELVIAASYKKAGFVAPGNIAPAELVAHPHLAALMRRAGYRQVFFADDRELPLCRDSDEGFIEDCHEAARLCHEAGFRARSDELAAGVSLGRAGEDLDGRARLVTHAAHALGSVVIWPYQPALAECTGVELDLVNGKLFPLRHQTGATYRDYLNIQGLAVVLNAKYREHTFDFLGDSMIARMFRDSLAREAWIPDAAVKGSLRLPVLPARGAA